MSNLILETLGNHFRTVADCPDKLEKHIPLDGVCEHIVKSFFLTGDKAGIVERLESIAEAFFFTKNDGKYQPQHWYPIDRIDSLPKLEYCGEDDLKELYASIDLLAYLGPKSPQAYMVTALFRRAIQEQLKPFQYLIPDVALGELTKSGLSGTNELLQKALYYGATTADLVSSDEITKDISSSFPSSITCEDTQVWLQAFLNNNGDIDGLIKALENLETNMSTGEPGIADSKEEVAEGSYPLANIKDIYCRYQRKRKDLQTLATTTYQKIQISKDTGSERSSKRQKTVASACDALANIKDIYCRYQRKRKDLQTLATTTYQKIQISKDTGSERSSKRQKTVASACDDLKDIKEAFDNAYLSNEDQAKFFMFLATRRYDEIANGLKNVILSNREGFDKAHACLTELQDQEQKVLKTIQGYTFETEEEKSQIRRVLCIAAQYLQYQVLDCILNQPKYLQHINPNGEWGFGHAICKAAKKEQLETLLLLIKHPKFEEVNANGKWGFGHAICKAAKKEQLETLLLLIKHPKFEEVNANGKDSLGDLCHTISAVDEHDGKVDEAVQLLLNHPKFEEVNPDDFKGMLFETINYEHIETLKILLAHPKANTVNPDDFGSYLIVAAHTDVEILRLLLAHSKFEEVNANGEHGFGGSICWASSEGMSEESFQILLAHPKFKEVNPDGKYGFGQVLCCGAGNGHVEALQILLADQKANEVHDGKHGFGDAIGSAAYNGHVESLLLLLAHSKFKEVRANGEYGFGGSIRSAAEQGKEEALRLLLEHPKANEVHDGKHGFGDAIGHAAYNGHVESLLLLLAHSKFKEVRANGEYGFGGSIRSAAEQGKEEALRLLLEHPKANEVSKEGEYGYKKIRTQLLENKRLWKQFSCIAMIDQKLAELDRIF